MSAYDTSRPVPVWPVRRARGYRSRGAFIVVTIIGGFFVLQHRITYAVKDLNAREIGRSYDGRYSYLRR